MNNLHRHLLATACLALLGLAGTVAGAQAQTCQGDTNCSLGTQSYVFGANDVFGGGSSLIAPYWRQTADCYGQPADLITKGTPPTFVDEDFFSGSSQNCATKHIDSTDTAWYVSTGSGSGILALFSHDPVSFWGVINNNGNQTFPEVHYAASDAGLGSSDLTVYNNGGSYTQGGTMINVAAPGAESCAAGQTNPYPNPLQCYGAMVQFPLSIDPIATFYANGGVYEKVIGSGKPEIDYHLNVQNGTKDGGLRLSVTSLCGIFNGAITNWNDPQLTADNNGISLEDPKDVTPAGSWSVPLYPVARSDSSGTTSIITRHLANVCAGLTINGKGNLYTTGSTTIAGAGAGSIVGQTYNVSNPNYPGVDTAGLITLAPNSSGVAQYVAFTANPASFSGNNCSKGTTLPPKYTTCIQQARVGYVGADYVMPYVAESQTNNYNLFSAAVENAAGNYIAVSPKAASTAFGSVLPPQSTSKGKYCANCTSNGMRNDPTAWVEGLSPSVPLANPQGANSYAIVGTTNFLGYTCYASAGALKTLTGIISYQETDKATTNAKKGILSAAGLSVLPKAWLAAIDDAFVKNKDKLNLELSAVSGGNSKNPNCSGTNGA
ncbi:MAG TPA: substrate-binding domain-containing protein [Rhizomicrobium sp.]|jgi:ABC-type phosphate transport system substrate-binding protein|nr:substrate-binding domain-containing protein [Rhizomicrobium sp.]